MKKNYLTQDQIEEYDEPAGSISVGELKRRLSGLPDDLKLQLSQFDYYMDLVEIEDTQEVIWKP